MSASGQSGLQFFNRNRDINRRFFNSGGFCRNWKETAFLFSIEDSTWYSRLLGQIRIRVIVVALKMQKSLQVNDRDECVEVIVN